MTAWRERAVRSSSAGFVPRGCILPTKTLSNAEEKVEIPFVMGVLSDLSGNSPGAEKEDLADRKLLEFDMDNLDARMAAIKPGVTFSGRQQALGQFHRANGRAVAVQSHGGF